LCLLTTTLSPSPCGQIAGGQSGAWTEPCSPNVGSFLSYRYDDADHLISVTDNLGNRVSYTLNGNGERISEVTKDPANVLAMTMGHAIDALGRVQSFSGAEANEVSTYTYDGIGDEKSTLDPNLNLNSNEYDALDRLKQVIDLWLKPLRAPSDEDLHEIIDERYERKATMVTSNLDISAWDQAFTSNQLIAVATIDRLRHRAYQITLEGKSRRAPTAIEETHQATATERKGTAPN
jgi:YD repeat-containing protein